MSTYQEVLSAALKLSVDERDRLIADVVATFDEGASAPPSQVWRDEVKRRSEQIDRGEMATSPWQEARARARRQVGLDR